MNLLNAREDNLQHVVPEKEVAFDKAEFAQRRHNIKLLMEQAGFEFDSMSIRDIRDYKLYWHCNIRNAEREF